MPVSELAPCGHHVPASDLESDNPSMEPYPCNYQKMFVGEGTEVPGTNWYTGFQMMQGSFLFLIRHLPAGRVFPAIQTTGHLEPFGGRRARDQIDDRLIIAKRLAAPIRGDEREQSVFHLVPFAGARRKVTDGNRKARFIRELLQLQFPEPQP